MVDSNSHKDMLRHKFNQQALFLSQSTLLRRKENLLPMMELAKPTPKDRMLDLACGWGFVSMEFAPLVKSAVGVDLAPDMVDLARREVASRKIPNVTFAVGDAESLEFEPGSFDLITCRFTLQHIAAPGKAVAEMRRVLAPGGRIVLYELVAPSDDNRSALLNEIESARDPSHVKIFTIEEFEALFNEAGLAEISRITSLLKNEFNEWMTAVGADEERRKKVATMMESAAEGDRAGIGLRARSGVITFTNTSVAWVLGAKPS